jgi:putative membrane protein
VSGEFLSDRPFANRCLLAVVIATTVWSGIRPADYATWFFELFLGAIGVSLLVATSRRYGFSNLVYTIVALHYVVLAVGAKYTYAEVPLLNWLRDGFGLARNHFDRVGHFAQGLTPALVVREALIRWTGLGRSRWTPICALSAALAFSAVRDSGMVVGPRVLSGSRSGVAGDAG